MLHLLAQDGKRRLGLDEPVLERLEHRLHVRERGAQVVARPGDELAACVEELLEARRHLVERAGEVGHLGRPRLRSADGEIAMGEPRRRVAHAIDGADDRAGEDEPGDDRDRRRRRRDGEDLDVVSHLERHPAGEQHRRERQADRESGESGELESEARQQAQQTHGHETDGEGQARRRRSPGRSSRRASSLTGRCGSRRPRRSGGGVATKDRPRSSRATAAREP